MDPHFIKRIAIKFQKKSKTTAPEFAESLDQR